MNRDFVEMLSALSAAGAEYVVVGAHALAAHGLPRAAGHLDLWVRPTPENAERVLAALRSFGAPLHDLSVRDLTSSETVFQIGVPPNRIDLLTSITGVTFDEAWPHRQEIPIGALAVPVLGKADLVRNKRALGRPKDLADLAALDEADS